MSKYVFLKYKFKDCMIIKNTKGTNKNYIFLGTYSSLYTGTWI